MHHVSMEVITDFVLLDFQKQGETEGGTDVQCRIFHDLEGVWKYGETRSSVFHLPNQN